MSEKWTESKELSIVNGQLREEVEKLKKKVDEQIDLKGKQMSVCILDPL